ncbi:hypothetical protein YDYSY3_38610 [Paenibacillus chitinolyticus]|uniref:DUF6094 domain-containing protein n=1 Tax=Paenibacillus chitinolyticus TaxID=79263 RepID=UPI0026E4B813|nr:DUF6094 domain-containing protein [Paenibacillus chitinolyticus]GKS12861.1 hypothetical protein YDYSY3_38610 [Paenibacillus chitinolyticus]
MAAGQLKGMFDRVVRNKVRMGNFETTNLDMECVRSFFEFPETPFSVADLCAGSGRAIEELTKGSSAVTFAIEPNEEKYLELRERVNHALLGGYEECRISRDTFNLMYLNPPYDLDSESVDSKVERKEKRFLRQLVQYVAADGLLVFNIPRGRMTKDIITILVANLEEIRIYQSHDDTYHQVYAMGRKRKEKLINRSEVNRIVMCLEPGNELPRLPYLEKPMYKVVSGNVTPKLFRSSHMDVDLIGEVLKKSTLRTKAMEWTTPKPPSKKLQPLLPDKEMHRVLRMASGKLNGRVGEGELLHVLKGIVKKETVSSIEETPTELIETQSEVFKITFKLIDREGNIQIIQS